MKLGICYKCSKNKVTSIVCYTVCTALVWVFCIFSLLYFHGPNYQIPSQRNWLSWAAFVHDILTFSFSRKDFFLTFCYEIIIFENQKSWWYWAAFCVADPLPLKRENGFVMIFRVMIKADYWMVQQAQKKQRDCNFVWVISMTHKLWLITYSYCRWAAR